MATFLRTFFLALKNNNIIFFLIRLIMLPVMLVLAGCVLFFVFQYTTLTDMEMAAAIGGTSGLVVVLLIIGFVRETTRLHREGRRVRRNVNLFIAFAYVAFAGTVYYIVFADRLMSTHKSPCGDGYTASVYTKPRFIAMPGDGGIGSSMAVVVVRNRWGWPIATSNDDCGVFYGDIQIGWSCESHELNFAPARSLNLKTGECNY